MCLLFESNPSVRLHSIGVPLQQTDVCDSPPVWTKSPERVMPEISTLGKLAAVLVTIPATIILAYWLFVRGDDDDEYGARKVETSRQTVIQVTVPKKAVGSVIGRQGSTIKEIQEVSGAKVHFSDHDTKRTSDDDRSVVIRGTPEGAQKAELMIHKIVEEVSNIVTEEIQVPGYCLGRIIGRGGENIRTISQSSQCKIAVDKSHSSQAPSAFKVVSITGSRQQIRIAKSFIEEKVSEEEESRAKTRVSAGNNEERKQAKVFPEGAKEGLLPLPSKVVEVGECWEEGVKCPEPSPVRDFMEVFVSAVEHPGHFWVQIITASSLQLDKMTDDMTAFYSNPETEQVYGVSEVKPGTLVAAPFAADKAWYRARILGMQEGKVDLYFIDFGDNSLVMPDQLRELKPEYLSLPVQAIECKLANVEPAGESWSDEACETFERLSHCSEWKILAARTVAYEPSPSGESLPCLQLSDNQEQVDIAAELVAQGFAKFQSSTGAMETVIQQIQHDI